MSLRPSGRLVDDRSQVCAARGSGLWRCPRQSGSPRRSSPHEKPFSRGVRPLPIPEPRRPARTDGGCTTTTLPARSHVAAGRRCSVPSFTGRRPAATFPMCSGVGPQQRRPGNDRTPKNHPRFGQFVGCKGIRHPCPQHGQPWLWQCTDPVNAGQCRTVAQVLAQLGRAGRSGSNRSCPHRRLMAGQRASDCTAQHIVPVVSTVTW